MGKTLFDKIYQDHLVDPYNVDYPLLYADGHLVFEVSSPQAFESLKAAGRRVRRPDLTLATVDHNVPTDSRAHYRNAKTFIKQPDSLNQVVTLEKNVEDNNITYFGMSDRRQGIVHVIGPEQGFTLPGTVLVCGDSHTSTHGAFGALAIGIGTSEVEHVLATQTLPQKKANNMRVRIDGQLPVGVYSKDIILHLIGKIGTNGAKGCVIEYCGTTIDSLSMEARMVICNMGCEAGARTSIIAPDEKTFAYLKEKPMAPKNEKWQEAMTFWRTLYSDEDAVFDKYIQIKAEDIAPTVTWGTTPDETCSITGTVPNPEEFRISDPSKAKKMEEALHYIGLIPGTPLEAVKIDRVFIGSCTNSRIEDLRSAAQVAKGRKVNESVYAMIVPGSGLVKYQAEKEGLDIIFKKAGFDWREAGCSMCLGMNPDTLKPGERCASTSNRNYEGRQGPGGRTHLCSPAMAAAAAIAGHLTDVRKFLPQKSVIETIPITYPVDNYNIVNDKDIGEEEPEPIVEDEDVLTVGKTDEGQKFSPEFKVLRAIAAPLEIANVNTGLLMMSHFLTTVKRTGLGEALFYEIRYDPVTGEKVKSCSLNQDPWNKANILVNNGPNFGIGSSREHAVWGLLDFGIKCIIATSFADLFATNCLKNGLLPIAISDQQKMDKIHAEAKAKRLIEVDLPNQVIKNQNSEILASFEIDPQRKYFLLNGIDDIALSLQYESKISTFEEQQKKRYSWLFGRSLNLKLSRPVYVSDRINW